MELPVTGSFHQAAPFCRNTRQHLKKEKNSWQCWIRSKGADDWTEPNSFVLLATLHGATIKRWADAFASFSTKTKSRRKKNKRKKKGRDGTALTKFGFDQLSLSAVSKQPSSNACLTSWRLGSSSLSRHKQTGRLTSQTGSSTQVNY